MNAIETAQAEILKQAKQAKTRALEDRLARDMTLAGIQFERQYRFHDKRLWRSDFAISHTMILIEVEGEGHKENGKWVAGAHLRSKGLRNDIEKQNEAVLMGFRPLRFTAQMIKSGRALNVIERMIETERYYKP